MPKTNLSYIPLYDMSEMIALRAKVDTNYNVKLSLIFILLSTGVAIFTSFIAMLVFIDFQNRDGVAQVINTMKIVALTTLITFPTTWLAATGAFKASSATYKNYKFHLKNSRRHLAEWLQENNLTVFKQRLIFDQIAIAGYAEKPLYLRSTNHERCSLISQWGKYPRLARESDGTDIQEFLIEEFSETR